MDENSEKMLNKAIGRLTLCSMFVGVSAWECGKFIFKTIKMAITGKDK